MADAEEAAPNQPLWAEERVLLRLEEKEPPRQTNQWH
jgi:hypothetical protein